ncbi:bifunctional 5,10-methylenetetrahydrofolate dehydrogenase/5,10-methenyltetrahydrofolate cyclohydrolase [Thermophilibacter provencensis]|uniref:Bifunctional protein FolD n=1 Tax=Thermophilibacter provencensis TaxID=1852386 RepID=A0ABT7V5J9_9ACTN|nr:bifunctional 5,10-methylenetetrahydrofolate dehydrogenase/5,10-methenyltetrahydrofolate cyclohydrolase [Thermophilibacter provencensis]MDM8271751.1 bifunctional 5,10-methylenetetrahydrofolate dehydrogenase/5,10-methenyltetrahydrofolate cyclohydrolase [Thermophilibacter provencensis]
MARLLKGAPAAAALTERTAARSAALAERGIVPTFAVVRVGERSDDLAYERAAEKRCAAAGVAVRKVVLPVSCDQAELNAALEELGAQDEVHGILLFRPLPVHLDEGAAATCIPAEKDVDCAGPLGLLATLSGRGAGFAPCTAEAVLALLDHYEVPLDGANVTVIGRSLVIGRPVAALLLARNATVTTCHTHTRDLAAACSGADVIVAAAGAPGTVGAACVHPGQVLVDVGTTWDAAAGRLRGDVDAEAVAPVVSALSPVPGGVGSLTTAILVSHVVTAAERMCA